MKSVDILIEELDLSIEELAERTGLAPQRLLAIAEGRWLPNPAERQKIASALDAEIGSVSWGHTMSPRVVRYHRYGLKEDFRKRE